MENKSEEIVLEMVLKGKASHVIIQKDENELYSFNVDGVHMGIGWRSKEEEAKLAWDSTEDADDYYFDYLQKIEAKLDELGK